MFIGKEGVGKTCFVTWYSDNNFEDKYIPTIGLDFRIKTIVIEEKYTKLVLWDMAGQERFKAICHSYYWGAHIFVIMYSITDRESFE